MIKLIDILKEALPHNNEIFSAYNGRYLFDITKAYKLIKAGKIKTIEKTYTPDKMYFLSHPELQAADPKKYEKLEIDYTKPIGLIANIEDPENGKKEWMLIDGNHRTRKAVQDNHEAKYTVISSPEDVKKFMVFNPKKPHELFPDDE